MIMKVLGGTADSIPSINRTTAEGRALEQAIAEHRDVLNRPKEGAAAIINAERAIYNLFAATYGTDLARKLTGAVARDTRAQLADRAA